MNALNLAIRCAEKFLADPDPKNWSAAQKMLIADALTTGLSAYWSLVPYYVTTPVNITPPVLSSGMADFPLPLGFRQITERVRIRKSGTAAWQVIDEVGAEPCQSLTGQPRYFRVFKGLDTQQLYSADYQGGELPDFVLRFYPGADADYELDLRIQYDSPVVKMKHLTGIQHAPVLPLSDLELVTNVVPMCAEAFAALDFKKEILTMDAAAVLMQQAANRVNMLPRRLTTSAARVRRPAYL